MPYWVEQVREHAHENCIIQLVGNKSDLFPSVTAQEIESLCEELAIVHVGTSSALLNSNVSE